MPRPQSGYAGEYFFKYIDLVPGDDILEAFQVQEPIIEKFFAEIPVDKHDHFYAPGKWTVKQVLQHLSDAERVFAYRALRAARKDETNLHGFDENAFADEGKAAARRWDQLVQDCLTVRKASFTLYESFDEEQLQNRGMANSNSFTPNAMGYIMLGHYYHHINILKERYF